MSFTRRLFLAGVLCILALPALAVTFTGSDQDRATGTTSITLNLPTHAADDYAVIVTSHVDDTNVATISTTGWTKVREDLWTAGVDGVMALFTKRLTSASETDPQIDFDVGGEHSAVLMVFSGVDTTTAFDVTEVYNNGLDNGNPTNSAITPTTDNGALLLFAKITQANITAWGAPATPSGTTLAESQVGVSGSNIGAAYLENYGTAATITPSAWQNTGPTGVEEWGVYTVTLRPAAGGGSNTPLRRRRSGD